MGAVKSAVMKLLEAAGPVLGGDDGAIEKGALVPRAGRASLRQSASQGPCLQVSPAHATPDAIGAGGFAGSTLERHAQRTRASERAQRVSVVAAVMGRPPGVSREGPRGPRPERTRALRLEP